MEITSAERGGDQGQVVIDLRFVKPFRSETTTTLTLQREATAPG